MRTFSLITLLLLATSVMAQRDGEKKDIDGQIFKFQKDVWIHSALSDNFDPSKDFTAVYKDNKYNTWYREGSPTLQRILELKPNVVFQFKDRSGKSHVYWVVENESKMKELMAGGAAVLLPGVAAAGSGAAGGAAAGGAAGGAAAGGAAAGGATIAGMSTGLALGVGGAVLAGAAIVEANNDDEIDGTPTRR